ncbi:MAG: hypothetical protein ABR577_04885 [Pyrinomonadaceae bacterium]
MRKFITVLCATLLVSFASIENFAQGTAAAPSNNAAANAAQSAEEKRVPLAEQSVAPDVAGRAALAGKLRTASTALAGTSDAPIRIARVVIENRSPNFYTYVSGWATFYDAEGVRCGEGLFKLDALAPNESAETDMPGLRLTCTPTTWRIAATNLLTRTTDTAKPNEPTASGLAAMPQSSASTTSATAETTPTTVAPTVALPSLMISINGKTLPLQLDNPVEIKVGRERVKIVVSAAP